MKYFSNCKNLEEVKQLYRKLAMQNHPDRGGDAEVMKVINSQYEQACKMKFAEHDMTEEEYNTAIFEMEGYRDAIAKVIGLEGITIELIGTWLWVTGNTKQHKDILNAQPGKFNWLKKKSDLSAWVFKMDAGKRYRRHGELSMDDIRAMHGSQKINPIYQSKIA